MTVTVLIIFSAMIVSILVTQIVSIINVVAGFFAIYFSFIIPTII